jgi:hypothetical protein
MWTHENIKRSSKFSNYFLHSFFSVFSFSTMNDTRQERFHQALCFFPCLTLDPACAKGFRCTRYKAPEHRHTDFGPMVYMFLFVEHSFSFWQWQLPYQTVNGSRLNWKCWTWKEPGSSLQLTLQVYCDPILSCRSVLEYDVQYVNAVTWHTFIRSSRSFGCKNVVMVYMFLSLQHSFCF